MSMYAKLMSRITESSLMEEPIPVRYTFMMLLAVADPKGYAIGTDIALARRLNMPLKDFKEAVAELMKPDPSSNSKEEEGRRLIESDGERGYYVVNYGKYRDTRNEEERREWMKDYMRNYRAKKAPLVNGVNSCKQRKPPLANAEAEAEAEALDHTRRRKHPSAADVDAHERTLVLPHDAGFAHWWFDSMEASGWIMDNGLPVANWKAAYSKSRSGHRHKAQEIAHRDATRYARNNHTPRPGHDRNAGTLNDPADYADS